jgi:hypothetical protein
VYDGYRPDVGCFERIASSNAVGGYQKDREGAGEMNGNLGQVRAWFRKAILSYEEDDGVEAALQFLGRLGTQREHDIV